MPHSDDAKLWGYMRVGIYEVLTSGRIRNFCDVHFYGGDSTLLKNARYSGPDASISDSPQLRGEKTVEKWRDESEVSDEYDIGAGGSAMLYSNDLGPYCFLFGPVKYDGRGYGSLVVDVDRFKKPTFKLVKDKTHGYVAEFKYPFTQNLQRCHIYQTDFAPAAGSPGTNWYGSKQMMERVKSAWWSKRLIERPKGVKSWAWRIEAGKSRMSWNNLMAIHG